MSLQQRLEEDFLNALKAKEEQRVSTLRMLKAAWQNKKIEKMIPKDQELSDEEMIAVIKTEIKKRKDSIDSYRSGQREDLVAKEQAEAELLEAYLPAQLSEEQVRELVRQALADLGVSGPSDFGKAMGAVMKQVGAQADGQLVSRLVKEELSK